MDQRTCQVLPGLAGQLRLIADALESVHQEQQITLPKEDLLLHQKNSSNGSPEEAVELWSPDDDDKVDPAVIDIESATSSVTREGGDEAGVKAEAEVEGYACFEMRGLWGEEEQTKANSVRRRKSTTSEIRRVLSNSEQSGMKATDEGIWQHFIAGPGAFKRSIWDGVGGILIVYDLLVIPLGFFELPQIAFLAAMDWVTLLYWTLGIFSTLTQGYVHQGVTVMGPRKILARYLSSWFWLDLVTLVPDWLFSVVISESSFNGNSVKLLRIARLTRAVRLLRVLRLKQLMESLDDLLDSEVSTIAAAIVKMLLLLLVINHYIACTWYLIAWLTSDSHPEDTWVMHNSMESEPWWRQYLVAYHWSITQFTPASMPVQPGNPGERAFAITVVVFALVGFSYVVGSITGSLTQLRSLSEKDAKQFWMLRRFLRHKQISFELSLRIRNFLDFEVSSRRGTVEIGEVDILKYLSNQMRSELLFELHSVLLLFHPLFSYMKDENLELVQTLCHSAISAMNVNKLDVVFQVDHRATFSYFLSQGVLHYKHQADPGRHGEEIFPLQTWISEPVMWVREWTCVGDLAAKEVSAILCMDVAKADASLRMHLNQLFHIRAYARCFVAWLNALDSQERSDVMLGEETLSCFRSFLPQKSGRPEEHRMGRLRRMNTFEREG